MATLSGYRAAASDNRWPILCYFTSAVFSVSDDMLYSTLTGVPITRKNSRIQAGCAGQAAAVTSLPLT